MKMDPPMHCLGDKVGSAFSDGKKLNMKTMQPSAHRHRYPARISLMLKPQTLMLQ